MPYEQVLAYIPDGWELACDRMRRPKEGEHFLEHGRIQTAHNNGWVSKYIIIRPKAAITGGYRVVDKTSRRGEVMSEEIYGAELDAAAEILQRVHQIGKVKCIGRREVARALRDLFPSDDDESVMPEWLESLGYQDSMGMRYEKRYELCNGIRIVFFACQHPQRWAAEIWVGGGKCYVKSNPARRDVRRLLEALGIITDKSKD